MSSEAQLWLKYARENREVAAMSLERELYNPCLQNAQQAVEKALKSALVCKGGTLVRTHSIARLRSELRGIGTEVELSDDDCDLLDSIYLPSKYPIGSALPNFEPDDAICRRCIALADLTIKLASEIVEK